MSSYRKLTSWFKGIKGLLLRYQTELSQIIVYLQSESATSLLQSYVQQSVLVKKAECCWFHRLWLSYGDQKDPEALLYQVLEYRAIAVERNSIDIQFMNVSSDKNFYRGEGCNPFFKFKNRRFEQGIMLSHQNKKLIQYIEIRNDRHSRIPFNNLFSHKTGNFNHSSLLIKQEPVMAKLGHVSVRYPSNSGKKKYLFLPPKIRDNVELNNKITQFVIGPPTTKLLTRQEYERGLLPFEIDVLNSQFKQKVMFLQISSHLRSYSRSVEEIDRNSFDFLNKYQYPAQQKEKKKRLLRRKNNKRKFLF